MTENKYFCSFFKFDVLPHRKHHVEIFHFKIVDETKLRKQTGKLALKFYETAFDKDPSILFLT